MRPGINVVPVPDGTVVEGLAGEEMVVRDGHPVRGGWTVYMTDADYAAFWEVFTTYLEGLA